LLTDEIIEFVANSKRFVPHFHIPLQSGSNSILKLMKRRYLRELYTERIVKIKTLMPDCCIGVDVIVGFPGETESHFLETYEYLKSLDVSYLHVFTYSEREKTEAVSMKGIVPIPERKKRNKMLRILSAKKLRAFYESQLGKEVEVLFEEENKNDFIYGYSKNYLRIKLPYSKNLVNTAVSVVTEGIDEEGNVFAKVLLQEPILA